MSRGPTHQVFASTAVVGPSGVLLVQEAKPDVRGLWNLPGGRVEPGERDLVAAARREVLEETGLVVEPDAVIRVYVAATFARLVLRAPMPDGTPIAGDEILGVRWVPLDKLPVLPDATLAHPEIQRPALDDLRSGRTFPLAVLASVPPVG